MSNRKAPPSFDIHQTRDGSPTMSLDGGEKMHASAGALSETLYIYGSCIEELLIFQPVKPKIMSMGLGLGYNEWLSLAMLHKQNISDFKILSFEKEDFLRESLTDYLNGITSTLTPVYDDISHRIAKSQDLEAKTLRALARECLVDGRLSLKGALSLNDSDGADCNAILYDAFSSGTDSELWTTDHFDLFLKNYASNTSCFFATYAATSNLKRTLRANDFVIKKKPGFAGKRDSVYATRLSENRETR